MLLWRDVANIRVGKELLLPLRIRFAVGQPTARPLFGKFWFCPLLESSLILESESLLNWMDLGGRTSFLSRRKDGTFVSGDDRVVARKTSPSEWILTSRGMEYRYIDGKIKSLKFAPDRVVEWVYQGSRIIGLSGSAEGTLLTIEYGGGQAFPTALVTQGNRVELKTQKVPSVSVVSGTPMVAGFEESLGGFESPRAQCRFPIEFDPKGNFSMKATSLAGGESLFVWDAASGILKSDGEWNYTTTQDPVKGPIVSRTNKSGQSESYYFDTKTGTSEYKAPDGTIVNRSYFIANGPTQYKIRRATTLQDGKEIAVRQWSYDEAGRLVRESEDGAERSWAWNDDGSLQSEGLRAGDKVIWQTSYDKEGRMVEKIIKNKTYRYAYEAGKTVMMCLRDGKVTSSRVFDAARNQLALFKLDEATQSLQGGSLPGQNAISPQEVEAARALANKSLKSILNEKAD